MKKNKVFAGCVAILLAGLVVSCNSSDSTVPKPNIKNNIDSLSYAYGVQLAENGLTQYLSQLGVVQDTAMFRATQKAMIDAEQDDTKKDKMQKALATRIDSLDKANEKNLAEFIKGVKESYNSSNNSQNAYYNGLQLGSQLKMMGEGFEKQMFEEGQSVNKEALLSGLIGALKKEGSLIENANEFLQQKAMEAQSKMMAKQEEEAKKANAATIEAGKKFLEENKEKPGVVTLPSGLQYKIIKEGKGAKPSVNSEVEVFYKGMLIDGKEFESNIGKESVKFPVNQVIKGWTEALQLMPVGSKWILYIPSELAYGSQQAGPIPPFSTLIFEIDLVGISK